MSKKKKIKSKKEPNPKALPLPDSKEENLDSMDYLGIPPYDLKKNLGCG